MFIKQLSLLDGILPSRYSYATGGVVNIQHERTDANNRAAASACTAGNAIPIQPSLPVRRLQRQLQLLHQRAL